MLLVCFLPNIFGHKSITKRVCEGFLLVYKWTFDHKNSCFFSMLPKPSMRYSHIYFVVSSSLLGENTFFSSCWGFKVLWPEVGLFSSLFWSQDLSRKHVDRSIVLDVSALLSWRLTRFHALVNNPEYDNCMSRKSSIFLHRSMNSISL